jgi:hypothetical protein
MAHRRGLVTFVHRRPTNDAVVLDVAAKVADVPTSPLLAPGASAAGIHCEDASSRS